MPEQVRLAEQSRSGIGFVFGALDAEAVPGPILVQLMAQLGFAESTTRQLLARMLRQGDLSRHRSGRVSVYRMDGVYLRRWIRLRHGDRSVAWQGGFSVVLYDLPERHRRQREMLQSLALRAGFAQLRSGVLIGLDEPEFVAAALATRSWPAGEGTVETGRLEVDRAAARRIAATAWRLAERAADLAGAREALERMIREPHPETGDPAMATRRLFQAIQLAGAPRYSAPVLPAELLPAHWPADGVHQALMAVVAQLQPQVGEFLYTQLLASPHADLIRGGWWADTPAGRVGSSGEPEPG